MERLLRWGTLGYCSVFPAVSRSYNRSRYPCPIEQKYHENGPYHVTVHSIDDIHVFIPDTVLNSPLPTVVMVNGTGLKARHYRPVFEHLASWGFIVIGNDDTGAWNGRSALVSLDKALCQNSMESSPLYQRIDMNRIGIVGHSQGAMGAINAATEDSRFKVLYAASCPQKSLAKKLGWSGGSLEDFAPGKCIGGDKFGNYEGTLPEYGTYHECDIDTLGKSKRGAKRIVYSDDGRIYYTGDHYETFELLYGEER